MPNCNIIYECVSGNFMMCENYLQLNADDASTVSVTVISCKILVRKCK